MLHRGKKLCPLKELDFFWVIWIYIYMFIIYIYIYIYNYPGLQMPFAQSILGNSSSLEYISQRLYRYNPSLRGLNKVLLASGSNNICTTQPELGREWVGHELEILIEVLPCLPTKASQTKTVTGLGLRYDAAAPAPCM